MAASCWVLRCCSCRRFQAQQAKRSGKWSCSVCGQRQALQKVYGQGSGRDCRLHVQKLNLLQGEAEEAAARTARYIEECENDNRSAAVLRENNLVQQGGRTEVSRWSKYLDKGSEDQEEGEEEGSTERQQFCSQRKNAVEERRKKQKSFLYSDVQENSEEDGAFQLANQAKKHKKCSTAVPDEDDVSADSVVPTVFESIVPQQNNQPPAACTKPSKWEKYLSYSNNCSENAVLATLSPQDGSGRLGPHSTTAPGSVLPSISCSGEKDALAKEPQSQVLWAGAGDFNSGSRPPAPTHVRPKPHTTSCERLFCTGDDFDDDF
ncbi:MRN complex-interacting protein isoform X2 [Gallus gallus]|uniref:MRN complex-interacting protein isoform X2 n=1 Tax=Gallus gallus TaxID=9031 RepID=UPI0003504890|nr:MRN complex-interacting protein isoform X2 [Gallus gallus]|eukprot:XP_004945012.1 MRN complex-interacting protein isoform X2 [Gallus gallus]